MNTQETINNYHYQRGYLDGSGNSNRMQGKTIRSILQALYISSESVGDAFFICDNMASARLVLMKTIDVAKELGFKCFNTSDKIFFENESIIRFVSVEELSRIADRLIGINLIDPVVIEDVSMETKGFSVQRDIHNFKLELQKRSR